MRISARSEYAVQSIIELASADSDWLTAESIASAQDIPAKFLEQIMADLRRAGLVRSRRGAEGGYALARAAEAISLADVIRAVDGPLAWVRDSRPGTVEYQGAAAPLREVWVAVRAALRGVLDEVSVADVVDGRLPPAVTDLTADPGAWND